MYAELGLKCSDEEKIRILDEYIVVVRHGNTDKIKFTDIASYACEKGYTNLKEFDFRQNDAVKKHIQEIQDGRVILSNGIGSNASARGITAGNSSWNK